jgi:hypothetical protein
MKYKIPVAGIFLCSLFALQAEDTKIPQTDPINPNKPRLESATPGPFIDVNDIMIPVYIKAAILVKRSK